MSAISGSPFAPGDAGNANFETGVLDIETVNPTCIVWAAGAEDSAARDTAKGMIPGHICIVKVCFTQGA